MKTKSFSFKLVESYRHSTILITREILIINKKSKFSREGHLKSWNSPVLGVDSGESLRCLPRDPLEKDCNFEENFL